MKMQKIKKGDVVCIADFSYNKESFVRETVVETVGPRYITVKGSNVRFWADTLKSVQYSYRLFKGTKDECLEDIEKRKNMKDMLRTVTQYFEWGHPDFELVEETYNKIKNLEENKEK